MASIEERLRRLYNRRKRLESKITSAVCDLAVLQSVMGPFLIQYTQDIIPLHEKLVDKSREINDLKVLRGEKGSRHRQEVFTPLTVLTREANLPVQEQYDRIWGGKEFARLSDSSPSGEESSEQVKAYYGKIVAESHPLLARNEREVVSKRKTFHDATKAFLKGDGITLKALADTFQESNLPTIADEAMVNRIEAQVEDLDNLQNHLESQLFEIRFGDAAKLFAQKKFMEEKGVDLMKELQKQFKEELKLAEETIQTLSI